MVWVEAAWCVHRLDRQEANRAVLLQMAVSTLFSKDAGKNFNDRIKKLTGE